MANHRFRTAASLTVGFLAVPWSAFVSAFLFYVGLTLVAISVEQLPDLTMGAAYLMPVAAYGLLLLVRTMRALAAMPVHIGQLAVPRLQ